MIEVRNLSRQFGDVTALDGISFSVSRGEVLGLLGPNGAGKTTTLRIIAMVLGPSSGTLRLLDQEISTNKRSRDLARIKERIGYLPDHPPLYRELTVQEMLRFVAKARGVSGPEVSKRVEESLGQCGLTQVSYQVCAHLSRGFRQRVGLACAILHKPEVLLLDEPMTALDPKQIHEIRDLIRRLSEQSAIILSTHILSEVSALCDRVLVMNKGCISLERDLSAESDVESVENMFLSAVSNY